MQRALSPGRGRGGKPGLFLIAHNGTIFLDEIGTTPKNVQARLLRVLQEKEVMRIGGDRMIPINIRVLSATNKNLIKEVQQGQFREDLFFRINVLTIYIPPLRERVEDIPILVKTLVKKAGKKYGLKVLKFPDKAVERLQEYSWPGNVRQLETFIERLMLLSDSKFSYKIFGDLFRELCVYSLTYEGAGKSLATSLKDSINLKNQEYESRITWKALQKVNYSKSKAAKMLGISRTTLWRKLKQVEAST